MPGVMIVKDLLREQTTRLQEITEDLAPLEARLLLCQVLQCQREDLILKPDRQVSPEMQATYMAFIERRLAGEPIAKILGEKEFWGMPFKVTTETLDPRPDSETLIEAVLERGVGSKRILDLGTGSGCLLLSFLSELKDALGLGVDVSPAALKIAKANACNLELEQRAQFVLSDWGDNVNGEFDIIISNPPYISLADYNELAPSVRNYDPRLALLGGEDGLDCYRKIAPVIHKHLAHNGFFAIEFGIDQERPVENILEENKLRALEFRKDLAGTIRCIIGERR